MLCYSFYFTDHTLYLTKQLKHAWMVLDTDPSVLNLHLHGYHSNLEFSVVLKMVCITVIPYLNAARAK